MPHNAGQKDSENRVILTASLVIGKWSEGYRWGKKLMRKERLYRVRSQSFRVRSELPDIAVLPSGAMATELTESAQAAAFRSWSAVELRPVVSCAQKADDSHEWAKRYNSCKCLV